MNKRFWELDLFKVIAIGMMIVFHLIYDLSFFGVYGGAAKWSLLGRVCAAIFILLVGINLSYSKKTVRQFILRGIKIFSLGMVITLITKITFSQYYVRFGILHFIGLSIILAIPFMDKKYLNLFIGAFLLLEGILAYTTPPFVSFDYFAILPWFGLILIGIFIGKEFYKPNKRLFKLKEPNKKTQEILYKISKNSLLIYFIHQPILIALLKLLNLI